MLPRYVYHSSPTQNLKYITLSFSTHGKKWVYATKDPIISAIFLGRYGGDYTVKVGRNEKKVPYITERFEGAFRLRYKGSGSIYKLDNEGFLENMTSWDEEIIKPEKALVIDEKLINVVWSYLLDLEKQKKLIISHYPDRYMLPKNDQDLIDKTVLWVKQFGENQLGWIKQYHPHLLKIVEDELQKK